MKKIHRLIIFAALLLSLFITKYAAAEETSPAITEKVERELPAIKQENFYIKLSIDNYLLSSQQSVADLTFSAISLLGELNKRYDLTSGQSPLSILSRAAFAYANYILTLVNHELGHAVSVKEFGGKIKKVRVSFDGSGEVELKNQVSSNPYHLQKEMFTVLRGVQQSDLLAQKLAENLFYHNKKIDPVTAWGYALASLDKVIYVQADRKHYVKDEFGITEDISNYIKLTDMLYGEDSSRLSRMSKLIWLNLLDPVLWASLYSGVTGDIVNIPRVQISDVGLSPFIQLLLTPYGVFEKRFGLYIFTDYSPIKVSFGFGKQEKTTTPFSYWKSVGTAYYVDELMDNGIDMRKDAFSGLAPGEKMKEYFTYSINLWIPKLLTLGEFIVGVETAFWNQPKLFVSRAYFEKPKLGGLLALKGSYQLNDSFNVSVKAGYKTNGFIIGYHAVATPIAQLGFEYKL